MFNYTKYEPDQCEYIEIANVDEVPINNRFFVEIDEHPIVVFNMGGEYFAIADLCSHDDGPLGDGDLDGYEVACPRHGARFDLRSGKALSLPAIVDIPAYPVRVVKGKIQLGLPIDT